MKMLQDYFQKLIVIVALVNLLQVYLWEMQMVDMTINLSRINYTNYHYKNKDLKSINEHEETVLQIAYSEGQHGEYVKIVDSKPSPLTVSSASSISSSSNPFNFSSSNKI